jgi:hypothetical protein
MAQEFEDFVPVNERLEFGHGELKQTVRVNLVN